MEQLKRYICDDVHIQTLKSIKQDRRLYLVGGTIRDFLIGIDPTDFDFIVTGSGIEFAKLVARKLHGALVILSEEDDEARVVVDAIVYDFMGLNERSLRQDLLRRDFTVNAMAIDCETGKFHDPTGGKRDLQKRVLRPTQKTSLADDPLRILRGFRFALELEFRLTRSFFSYAKGLSVKDVAAERIGYEMLRIMNVPRSYVMIHKMNELGLFQQLFPEANKIIDDDYLWAHSLGTYEALESLIHDSFFTKWEPEFTEYFQYPRRVALVKFAGLFHDVAKPDSFLIKEGEVHFYGHDIKGARIVRTLGHQRLKLSRNDVGIVQKLVKEHMRLHLLATNKELTDRAIRRFFRDLEDDWFGAMMIAWADGFATAGWTRHLEELFTRMIELKRADDALPKIERLINGHDLIALGYTPGPKFKVVLQELYDLQLEGKLLTKEQGIEKAQAIYENL